MIPTKPPPTFRDPEIWSQELIDFTSKCLIKNPDERANATDLLQVRSSLRFGRLYVYTNNLFAKRFQIHENV